MTIFLAHCVPFTLTAQAAEIVEDQMVTVKAKVLNVLGQEHEVIDGVQANRSIQKIQVRVIEGPDEGMVVTFSNDYIMLKKGDTFYLSYTIEEDGRSFFSVYDPDRTPMLAFFAILFVVLVVIFGGVQGVRGLISLAGSLLVIVFVLLPGIIQGISPLVVSVAVSSVIIILGSYITHGFNKTTSSAVYGMIITVIITGLMAYFAVHKSYLTGLADDESFYLSYNVQGGVDLVGVLMGGIMIGLLGVLYDVAIGQSISVEELYSVAPHLDRWTIYKRALRIGREHIGALVNTLAIAYVGASLPLLLLFYSGSNPHFVMIANREVFATEIIRILIGSIGLVLAVPITTLLAVYMLVHKKKHKDAHSLSEIHETIEKEKLQIKNFHHHHSH